MKMSSTCLSFLWLSKMADAIRRIIPITACSDYSRPLKGAGFYGFDSDRL
jgi:hypothetical protein